MTLYKGKWVLPTEHTHPWEAEGFSCGFVSHTDKLFAKKAKRLIVTDAANEGLGFCGYDTAIEEHL